MFYTLTMKYILVNKVYFNQSNREYLMKAEFTAIIGAAPEGGYWAICPEIPGANGQGNTIDDTQDNLRQAIELILKDRREDIYVDCEMMLFGRRF